MVFHFLFFFIFLNCGNSECVKIFKTLNKYFLLCNKKSRFDFADELKVGYVRYKHLT